MLHQDNYYLFAATTLSRTAYRQVNVQASVSNGRSAHSAVTGTHVSMHSNSISLRDPSIWPKHAIQYPESENIEFQKANFVTILIGLNKFVNDKF